MMNINRHSRQAVVLCLVFLLSGCGVWKATKKIGEVIMDPDTPVGQVADQPSTIRLILLAEPDINPNDLGEATPTEIAVIYLSEDSKLRAADYDQLSSEMIEKTLGKNYIDHQEYTLVPDRYKVLPPIKLKEDDRYIGVIARFADTESSEWKKIIKVKSIGENYQVLIHLRTHEIELRKEDE